MRDPRRSDRGTVMRRHSAFWRVALTVLVAVQSQHLHAQAPRSVPNETRRGELLTAARSIMVAARYATLATIAIDGSVPQARIVDPLTPDTGFVVWVATNPATRKVAEIQKSGRATLLYFDAKALEYVTLVGRATIVSDPTEMGKHWKQDWDQFYPRGASGRKVVLIRVAPERVEVVSPSRKIVNDTVQWRPPTVRFGPPRPQ
jgi:general stress protein 26